MLGERDRANEVDVPVAIDVAGRDTAEIAAGLVTTICVEVGRRGKRGREGGGHGQTGETETHESLLLWGAAKSLAGPPIVARRVASINSRPESRAARGRVVDCSCYLEPSVGCSGSGVRARMLRRESDFPTLPMLRARSSAG